MNESHGGISDESNTDVEEVPLNNSSPYSWSNPPDIVLLQVFQYLSAKDLLTAGESCKTWSRVSKDECLWKSLFYRKLKGPPLQISTRSYLEEYKRLAYHVPNVETEVLTEHGDKVRHVSFSHNGKYFATCSDDGYLIVWNSSYPASIKNSFNTRTLGWAYPLFSQFNHSDTMLAVTGKTIELFLHEYENAFFSLEDTYPVKHIYSKRLNNLLLGTWYNDWCFLSGHIPLKCNESRLSVIHFKDLSLDPVELRRLYQLKIRGSIKRIIIASPPILSSTEQFSVIESDDSYNLEKGTTKGSAPSSPEVLPSVSNEGLSSKNIGGPESSTLKGSTTKSVPQETRNENELSKQRSPVQDNLKKDMNMEDSKVTASGKLLIFSTAPGKCYSITFVVIPSAAVEIFNSKGQKKQFDEPIINENVSEYIVNFDEEILDMALSPDHRYLFVKLNSLAYPEDPLEEPTGIIICVIDLVKLEVKEDTCMPPAPNERLYEREYMDNIFLDACDQYVTSGCQNYAYIWDTHTNYVAMLLHDDAVTAVSFNPCDSETLVTVSDDSTVRVWRSKNRVKNLVLNIQSL